MIAIFLPGYPSKHQHAELTVDGASDARWDLDVYDLVAGFRIKDPVASREGLDQDAMVDVLFAHDNGSADEFLRVLGVDPVVISAGWHRHLESAQR